MSNPITSKLREREVPDYIEDIELQLAQLLKRLPQDLNILHALAASAAIRHDVPRAREHYRQIIEINARRRNS